ncbi:uncharacterized protein PADG_01812 [Paracoccidioides brasiliensis Pb18]|uniref:Hsp70-like protein n=1 Tax=Paracoccidioides brasiliensis (strain Pb18) TaxID=502780 RepID=C1G4E6_PARBD|nr:uncharacterized protein PADG_01812 [Paracoccidioides brasiliensis Pb18]EEH45662.2 hypothetical protein PADG_01812 [Paracoccidioides brasiliensis Pb18]ODH47945.1 hypothetical protein GX48_05967 [Paracoccidioides brasiliensis]
MALRNMSLETIYVGIDVGLTHTGVAFSTRDMDTPLDVDRWPGNKEVAKKVPTKLWYRAGCKKPVSWGFDEPEELHRGMDVIDCFKLYLDPDFHTDGLENSSEVFWTNEDVQMWFVDFLTALRQYIIRYIRNAEVFANDVMGDWKLHPVEYLFSFPTTWQNSKVVETFSRTVTRAGFGGCAAHSVEIKLSEAAAAAVYSAKYFKSQRSIQSPKGRRELAIGNEERIRKGDVILICDAGGGTTDVSVLKVLSTQKFEIREGHTEEVLELEQLDFVNGRPIGSVRIDQAFQRLIETRLKCIDYNSENVSWSLKYAARDLTKGSFQTIKENFGYQIESVLSKIAPYVPGLPRAYHNPEEGFENGRIILTGDDIRKLFDEQICRIFSMIDEQLRRIRELSPSEQVTHFVLSGGLGSSPYVQDCFKREYGYGKAAKRILISEDPQLAVCRGLVIDRIHRLRYGHSIISSRRSCHSYGIVFNNRLSQNKRSPRQSEGIKISPYDRKRYAVNQIEWLIKRDQLIHQRQYISRKFNRVFHNNSSEISWKDLITMSQSPATRLPQTSNEGDARIICEIDSRVSRELLRQHPKPVKVQKWWGSKRNPEFLKIQYEVRLVIGSSHLKFEVWFEDMVIGESDEVPVNWQYTSIDEASSLDTQASWPVDWSNCGHAGGTRDK